MATARYRAGRFITLPSDPRIAPGFAATVGTLGRFGGVTYECVGSAATSWKLVSKLTWAEQERLFAESVISPANATAWHCPFLSLAEWATASQAGTGARAAGNANGGAFEWTTGATAGSSAYNTTVAGVFAAKTNDWYFSCLMKVTTAVDAQTDARIGLWDSGSGNVITVGVRGATSATKFCLVNSPGLDTIISTISVDTALHLFRCWHTGGYLYLAVDAETPQRVADTNVDDTHIMRLMVTVANGTTAAARTLRIGDFFLYSGSQT